MTATDDKSFLFQLTHTQGEIDPGMWDHVVSLMNDFKAASPAAKSEMLALQPDTGPWEQALDDMIYVDINHVI